MSSEAAISVRGLTKEYRLGQQKGRSALSEVLANPFRRNGARRGEWFRALDDVSFDVAPGTALGVIGRNGAGKSTLLKVLSRITKPTAGEVVLRGRVGSLLEVGTGFHPELTGRENVFMNGAMLGMRRAEIARKFDEIVAFAEVERFIDTPVKRYSSGMYVRLAFAVAAHLEPEILLVDEVLAVGDVAFQKKCLGKMGEVAGEGRTVLFVSHNTAAIRQLTSMAVALEGGHLAFVGQTPAAIDAYLGRMGEASSPRPISDSSIGLVITEVAVLTENRVVALGASLQLAVHLRRLRRSSPTTFRIACKIVTQLGATVGTAFANRGEVSPGDFDWCCYLDLDTQSLAPGRYRIAISVGLGEEPLTAEHYDIIDDAAWFEVGAMADGSQRSQSWDDGWGHTILHARMHKTSPRGHPATDNHLS